MAVSIPDWVFPMLSVTVQVIVKEPVLLKVWLAGLPVLVAEPSPKFQTYEYGGMPPETVAVKV